MTISNISKATWQVEIKFHVEPHLSKRTKVCSNCPGQMVNMTAMPILYGKTLLKPLTQEPID